MSSSARKKFLVMYLAPVAVMAEWAKTDPAVRKAAEEKMRADWNAWMAENAKHISLTEAAGKTKLVTSQGTSDTKNDIMLYSVVEAESQDEAARIFSKHPHLTIPQSSIQVMEVRSLGPPQ
jgi:hypothetical protein